MGKYFVMSMRFNKRSASDFGLVPVDLNMAVNPEDNSVWKRATLYDFGWGKENGFYKYPLLEFEDLFELVLCATDREDVYGAAARSMGLSIPFTVTASSIPFSARLST